MAQMDPFRPKLELEAAHADWVVAWSPSGHIGHAPIRRFGAVTSSRSRLAVVALVLVVGCGRLAFEPQANAPADDAPGQDAALSAVTQQAYIKASNSATNALFGIGMALSTDGSTLAVGALGEASNAIGIDGDQTNTSMPDAGAVYIFTRTGEAWQQQAYIKASDTAASDRFGISVALSADGSTLAVGAYTDNAGTGAVYMFTRSGTTWSQRAKLLASNAETGDRFGDRVALSAGGTLLAASAYFEDSAAMGIDGTQTSNAAPLSGAVYVFEGGGDSWSQQAFIKASNTDADDLFGFNLAFSVDGTLLAVGAEGESSKASGVDGDQSDNSAIDAGAVYVFARSDTTWTQQAYIKASNTAAGALFGVNLALSGDGSTLVVGANAESSRGIGIDGEQTTGLAPTAGAAYVFVRAGASWVQQAYVKASNTNGGDAFGSSIGLSADGSTMVIGAIGESSSATGINGDQADNSISDAGSAYVFIRSDGQWTQATYLKALDPAVDDELGLRAALSSDGGTLAICAYQEPSNADGVNGDAADTSAPGAGAVYIFE